MDKNKTKPLRYRRKTERRNLKIYTVDPTVITTDRWIPVRFIIFLISFPSFHPQGKLNILFKMLSKVFIHFKICKEGTSGISLPALHTRNQGQ